MSTTSQTTLHPEAIVKKLDNHIIGQYGAKRAVAIALRNRWRRAQLDADLRSEITPKNILMIGPTGVGKTEIARRLAALVQAPFIKVEATKFTEVGYVGRDVESIIRDLTDIAIKMARERAMESVKDFAKELAEEHVLDALVPPAQKSDAANDEDSSDQAPPKESAVRQLYRKKLRAGELDEKEIEMKIAASSMNMEIIGPPGMEEMVGQLQNMMQSANKKPKKMQRIKVKHAMQRMQEEEAANLINEEELKAKALEEVEQNGIVFLDEVDKIVKPHGIAGGGQVSREGVQRDLLPLVEGSTVYTKYGWVKTDHILFIASGAFHLAKPSDLIPELQGRFPIRVELQSLKADDFVRILTEPNASLTEQYIALIGTEEVQIQFAKDGIARLAELAYQVNETTENIGARRLHTILEKLLEEVSFNASTLKGKKIRVTAKYVDKQLKNIATDEDLSRYIL